LKDSSRDGSNYVAPRTPLERAIASIWQEVLKLKRVGVEERFFDAGGNSLLVVRLCSRVREELGRELPLIEVFRHPTIKALAGYLSEEQPAKDTFGKIQDRANMREVALSRQRHGRQERMV
jgi:acyl carrier protein